MIDRERNQQDLTVRGESVERVYGQYRDSRYVVNRRYQRKLVWTLDEKRRFIDSIMNGYPVPIILLAENRRGDRNEFEIIDGMQRLNAIMSFLENEFSVDGQYFDLNTMADTKALLDSGTLIQQEPVLPRSKCVRIAAYTVPLSIYEFSDKQEVDEVFRRINSGGRKLSRQELRVAGSTGHFAQAVRTVATRVRGDVSAADELLLNDMKKISIAHRDLPYGLDADSLFWIRHAVLTKEQVRESKDEEIVADILAFMLIDPPPSSRSEFLDDYFGLGEREASKQRFEEIELAVQKHSVDVVAADFQRVLDELEIILSTAGKTFGQLLFRVKPGRAPRYFQVVFLALHKLLVKDSMEIQSYRDLANLMEGSGEKIQIQEGGKWGAQDRISEVNRTAGLYGSAFRPAAQYDPARHRWVTQFENILTQSYTEESAYDFKQGLLRLDATQAFDEGSFEKILKTLVGIANIRRGTRGYVILGVADNARDAHRVREVFGIDLKRYERFYITGVEHEATALGKSLDQLFQLITDRIRQSPISEPLRDYIARHVKPVRYYDKSVIILESRAQDDPSHYDTNYYVRHGSQLDIVRPEEYAMLFRRFLAGF